MHAPAIDRTKETPGLGDEALAFYRSTLELLNREGVPYLMGGAFAFQRYTGVARHTKDIDLFLKRSDFDLIAAALRKGGLKAELTYPHWIGKAFKGDEFIDLIFGGGNGEAVVDDEWFEYAVYDTVFGVPVRLCPVEEIIWSKSFVMERERYDGADIHHLLRARGEQIDWHRLLRRFGDNWRLLMFHLVMFGFVYPNERHRVSAEVLRDLAQRLEKEREPSVANLCRGTLISRAQYLVDIDAGAIDARLQPIGKLTQQEIDRWTAAIGEP